MSERSKRICRLLNNQESRASYIKAKLGVLVPSQIRALRMKSQNPPLPRQRDLANETGLHQSRISMFETPGAANMTIETLANVAAGLRVGLIVKFVPFSEMLRWENAYSQDAFDVNPRLEQDEAFLNPEARKEPVSIAGGSENTNQLSGGLKKEPQGIQEGGKAYAAAAAGGGRDATLVAIGG
jgi:transcriptional regulator with XRE-family HTH domain